jgi:CD36 family
MEFNFLGFPLLVSLPHFYKGDPRLADQFTGLNPIKKDHEGLLVYQPVSVFWFY